MESTRKYLRKGMSLFLSGAMVFAFAPAVAPAVAPQVAGEYVAFADEVTTLTVDPNKGDDSSPSSSGYKTLSAAVSNASEGATITLAGDVEIDSLTINRKITIDGNGKTITVKPNVSNNWGYGLVFQADSTLKNVTIARSNEDGTAYFGGICAVGTSGASNNLTLENVTTNFDYANGNYNWSVVFRSSGTLTISGCNLAAKYVVGARDNNGTIIINNSTAAAGWAVIDSHGDGKKINISDSTLTSKNIFSNPEGKTWNNYAMFAFTDGQNNSVNVTNSTIFVESTGNAQQAISGGNSTSANSVGLGERNTVTLADSTKTVFKDSGAATLAITGGIYNSDPRNYISNEASFAASLKKNGNDTPARRL